MQQATGRRLRKYRWRSHLDRDERWADEPLRMAAAPSSRVQRGSTVAAIAPSGTRAARRFTLEAVPADDSVFTGWSGCDASEDTTCTVTMAAAKSVTTG